MLQRSIMKQTFKNYIIEKIDFFKNPFFNLYTYNFIIPTYSIVSIEIKMPSIYK